MPEHFYIEHQGMVLDYLRAEHEMRLLALNTDRERRERIPGVAYPQFLAALTGRPYGFQGATVSGYASLPLEMLLESCQQSAEELTLCYRHKGTGLVVLVHLQFIPGTAVIRQVNTALNEGTQPITLTQFSSTCLQGLASDGVRGWSDPAKLRLHYCRQAWEGEGQWRQDGLEELGLYHTSVHPCGTAIHVHSLGSYSTASYLPMAVLEDLETHKVWYWQIETSTSWHYEVGYRASWTDDAGGLFMDADAASERYTGWYKTLAPGESFTSVPVAYGCCNGGFEQAVQALTDYRRSTLKPSPTGYDELPLVFNDYMNCLWGNPTAERLLPLIDAAADVGAEAFCIDAGWFAPASSGWGNGLGDWQPSADRFGADGLAGILRYITAKELVPGAWLEFEVCGESAALGDKPDDWFLQLHGKRIGGGSRWFLNLSNPEVRAYLHGVFDRLVAMGVGYIKNDYNECTGPGVGNLGVGEADGLLQHIRAVYSFVDEVRARHPRLIIENCGSGAMREDYGALSHFHLQSSSDQEIHTLYPAVLAGSLAAVLPEQLGVWAFPWPLLFKQMQDPAVLTSEAYRHQMADGEQTIFNMVSGLCGNLYLSGRIDCADEVNLALIREAIALYKQERPFIRRSHPVWPLGMPRFNDTTGWVSVGLANEDDSRILLAVWRLGSAEAEHTLHFARLAGRRVQVSQLYPARQPHAAAHFAMEDGSLTVALVQPNSARYFELRTL
ncbi:MAG: glycoside hydrolase family 36 protein [Anaerolineae bacterium]